MNGDHCPCEITHPLRRVVLTGGPGAGKTAALELVRKSFCRHVHVLPEAATILFGGGFPREEHPDAKKAGQRAIYYIQRELEALPAPYGTAAVTVCDRGTLDGLAYWPGAPDEMSAAVGTTIGQEMARYQTVIHLRTPSAAQGYNHSNSLRTESAAVAADIDERIANVWSAHPRRLIVESRADFLTKAAEVLGILRAEIPGCCQGRRH